LHYHRVRKKSIAAGFNSSKIEHLRWRELSRDITGDSGRIQAFCGEAVINNQIDVRRFVILGNSTSPEEIDL